MLHRLLENPRPLWLHGLQEAPRLLWLQPLLLLSLVGAHELLLLLLLSLLLSLRLLLLGQEQLQRLDKQQLGLNNRLLHLLHRRCLKVAALPLHPWLCCTQLGRRLRQLLLQGLLLK